MASSKRKKSGVKSKSKSRSGPKVRRHGRPVYREVWGGILFVLGLCSLAGYFRTDAILINWCSILFRGLVGYGYWASLPTFLLGSWILIFHRNRKVKTPLTCAFLIPVLAGCLGHLLHHETMSPTIGLTALILRLWVSGQRLTSGGLLSGILASLGEAFLSRPVSILLCIVGIGLLLLQALRQSPRRIAESLRELELPHYYEEEDEPLPLPPSGRRRGTVPGGNVSAQGPPKGRQKTLPARKNPVYLPGMEDASYADGESNPVFPEHGDVSAAFSATDIPREGRTSAREGGHGAAGTKSTQSPDGNPNGHTSKLFSRVRQTAGRLSGLPTFLAKRVQNLSALPTSLKRMTADVIQRIVPSDEWSDEPDMEPSDAEWAPDIPDDMDNPDTVDNMDIVDDPDNVDTVDSSGGVSLKKKSGRFDGAKPSKTTPGAQNIGTDRPSGGKKSAGNASGQGKTSKTGNHSGNGQVPGQRNPSGNGQTSGRENPSGNGNASGRNGSAKKTSGTGEAADTGKSANGGKSAGNASGRGGKKNRGKSAAAVVAEQEAAFAKEIAHNRAMESDTVRRPGIELLTKNTAVTHTDANALNRDAKILQNTLRSFDVSAELAGYPVRGPSVTRYDFQLAQGVKLSKITNLADDIALALGSSGVRIAPVPSRNSVVGIEVPNRQTVPVLIRDVLEEREFYASGSDTAFAVGKDVSGRNIVGVIEQLPHVLIAGTTGSGKSVCINSLIVSLLYKSTPDRVKFIMIDPKMVELAPYNGIPHLLNPVVTDPKKAAGALQWAVGEMMNRYHIFAENGVKNLMSYNRMARKRKDSALEPLFTIVIVIDELADLMLAAAKEVEESIIRVAQMGRAAGIHLVIATQRPSADVITGLMKANIPSRIAFAVASAMESRIILDTAGAEKLMGRGDMLYAPLGEARIRVQGCYISPEEIEKVIEEIRLPEQPRYDSNLTASMEASGQERDAVRAGRENTKAAPAVPADDELLSAAVDVVLDTGQASVSMLQRRLKLGYSRAARLVDKMEEQGYVGPFEGSRPRQILITREEWKQRRP